MSDPQALPQPITTENPQPLADGTYPMSAEGRRQAIILLLGVLSLAIFALWSLVNLLQDGLSDVEWVTAAFMLAIFLVSPLVLWTLLEEANAVVTSNAAGLTYRTLGGVSLQYKWPDVTGLKPKQGRSKLSRFFLGDDTAPPPPPPTAAGAAAPAPADAPGTLFMSVRTDPALQINNPIVRFLHKQAYGDALPLHGGLANRDLLISNINEHTSANL